MNAKQSNGHHYHALQQNGGRLRLRLRERNMNAEKLNTILKHNFVFVLSRCLISSEQSHQKELTEFGSEKKNHQNR